MKQSPGKPTIVRALSRREAMSLLGVSGAALSFGCGAAAESAVSPSSILTGTAGACAVTPTETVGPFPSLADFLRSDIREGRPGVPLALAISVVNVNNGCAPVASAAVDVWQCDAEGHYSQYSQSGYNGTGATFLRGIQLTDGNGIATFTTIYPGWYQGRATHIHVEILQNGVSRKVTQIAFPESVTAAVYASGVYATRGSNPTTNASDGIFADSLSSEMAMISGDPASGYTASFTVGISA